MHEVAVAERMMQLSGGDAHGDDEHEIEEELEHAGRTVRLFRVTRQHPVELKARGGGVRGHGARISAERTSISRAFIHSSEILPLSAAIRYSDNVCCACCQLRRVGRRNALRDVGITEQPSRTRGVGTQTMP